MEVLRRVLPDLAAACLGGVVAAGAMVATDLGSLRHLMAQSQDGWLAGALLAFGFAGTFGAVAVGAAVVRMAQDPD
jgi:hypothetical protein